jgi:hypothetical protein
LARGSFAGGRAAGLGSWHITGRNRAHNIRLDDQVAWSTNHQKVFDVVAANQDKAPPSINGCRVDYGKSRLPSARSISEPVCSKASHQPRGEADKRQHHQKGDEKAGGQRHLSAEQALEHQCAPFFPLMHIGRESPVWLILFGTICP